MAIKQRRPFSTSLTFRIVKVVNQLRQCLKLRVSGLSTDRPLLGSKTCLHLDSRTFRAVRKRLSRISPKGRRQLHCASRRNCRERKSIKPSLKVDIRGQHDDAAHLNTSGEELQHVLRSLDSDTNISSSDTLSSVCSDERLFLQSHSLLSFDASSLNEIIRSLVLVHGAINILCATRSQFDDAFIIAQGNAIGLSIDAVFIANYEHLLLVLQAQLIDALAQKVVGALIENNVDKRQRKLLTWFTEFPDNRHPLSTTWPWSIRPSLAVLWGVCWMFYDNERNPQIPQSKVLQDEQVLRWGVPQASDYYNFGLAQLEPVLQQNRGSGDSSSAAAFFPGTHLSGGGERARQVSRAAAQPLSLRTSALGSTSRLDSLLDPFGHGSQPSTYYSQAIPSPIQVNNSNFGGFGGPGIPIDTVFAFPLQQFDGNNVKAWPEYTQQDLPPQSSTSHLTNPIITLTKDSVDVDSDAFAAPQDHFSSFDIYQHNAQQSHTPHLNINTHQPDFMVSSFNMGNCPPPDTSPVHTTHMFTHERNSSVHSNSNMPTPISMDNRSPLLSPVDNLRRQSVASSHGHLRRRSEDSTSHDDDDDTGLLPKKNYSYKRVEEPPRNQDNKMVCKYQGCGGVTFDRKCEWSKHMDKHDRPYKCAVKGCEKLQGFTYSGGLLRHEREVHKMHGGTKKSLFCPFVDCKRHSGSGFTRKENLAEHIRRVHRRTSVSSDLGQMGIPRSEDDAADVRNASESPYTRSAELPEDTQPTLKRKRISESVAEEGGEETDMRAEIKRLRRENEEKDARLRQLEQAVRALQQSHR